MIPFWPVMGYPTGLVGRIGRMLFWFFTVLAGLWLAGAVWVALNGESQAAQGAVVLSVIGAVFYAVGRGLVYIMADE